MGIVTSVVVTCIVEQFEFVLVSVAEELADNCVLKAIYDSVVVAAPDLETVVGAGWNVSDDGHFFAQQFGRLELADEPGQFVGRVRGVQQEPPVLVVAVVHVEGNEFQLVSQVC